jgi:hypothetical protein
VAQHDLRNREPAEVFDEAQLACHPVVLSAGDRAPVSLPAGHSAVAASVRRRHAAGHPGRRDGEPPFRKVG